jgi:putative transposase
MTRIARIVAPGHPHHVTQRGNRGERIFFETADYRLYKDWLAESCRRFGGEGRSPGWRNKVITGVSP